MFAPASTGEFESAMKDCSQTKEHAVLLKALGRIYPIVSISCTAHTTGVTQIVVIVNKMDCTRPIGFDRDRYEYIVALVILILINFF